MALAAGAALLAATLALEFAIARMAWSGLTYALAFGAIIMGAASWERSRESLTIPFARALGDASYTLYLIHVPVMGMLLKVAVKLGLVAVLPGPIVYAAVLVGIVLISQCIYWMVERRFQLYLKGRRPVAFPDPTGNRPASETRYSTGFKP